MKRSLLLLMITLGLLAASCDKRYTYIQYGRTFEGEILANPKETIKAKTDADAYTKALAKFGTRVVVSKQFIAHITDSAELKTYTPYPYCYTLTTEKGERISDKVSEAERKEAQDKVFALMKKLLTENHVPLDRTEIADKDMIK